MNFYDINSLNEDQLRELSFLTKCQGLTFEQAINVLNKKYPGAIKNLGTMKDGKFESNEITKDGVKTLEGSEGIANMIHQVLKNNKGKKNEG